MSRAGSAPIVEVRAPLPGGALRFRLEAEPVAVRRCLAEVTAVLLCDLPRPVVDAAELVLAEVLNNIVEHAYRGCGGPVVLRLRQRCGVLLVGVADRGRPMPPGLLGGDHAPPRLGPPGLTEGGFGWPIIRRFACHLRYRRAAGWNRLRFRLPVAALAG